MFITDQRSHIISPNTSTISFIIIYAFDMFVRICSENSCPWHPGLAIHFEAQHACHLATPLLCAAGFSLQARTRTNTQQPSPRGLNHIRLDPFVLHESNLLEYAVWLSLPTEQPCNAYLLTDSTTTGDSYSYKGWRIFTAFHYLSLPGTMLHTLPNVRPIWAQAYWADCLFFQVTVC